MRYTTSGNFGDMLHELYVIRELFEKTGIKGELFLMESENPKNGYFEKGAKHVISEIRDFFISLGYISDVQLYTSDVEVFINLDDWRYNGLMYKKCWTEILCESYGIRYPKEINPWIYTSEVNEFFTNKVVIHESDLYYRKHESFPWESILKNNECIFVSFDERQYENFKYKDLVDFHKLKDLEDCCVAINSCKFYVGNLTSITAVARAMCKPSLVEILCEHYLDGAHYIGEKKYWKNFFYISDIEDIVHTTGIESFLKLG